MGCNKYPIPVKLVTDAGNISPQQMIKLKLKLKSNL